MRVSRCLVIAMAAFTAAFARPVLAQGPETVKQTNDVLEEGGRWHFTGKIVDVNPGSRNLTIRADSVPSTGDPVPADLPFTVPTSVSMDHFHKGDRVTGDLTLQKHLLKIVNIQVGNGSNHKDSTKPKKSQ